jgi:ATP-dependent RNA helicase SUPV3L1/SUV3
LRSLGFRLERRKRETANGTAEPVETAKAETAETETPKTETTETETPEPALAAPAESASQEAASTEPATDPAKAAEPEFDEIWRPGKRKDAHRARHGGRASKERKDGTGHAKRPPHQSEAKSGKPQGKRKGKGRGPAKPHHGKGKGQGQRQDHDSLTRERPEQS